MLARRLDADLLLVHVIDERQPEHLVRLMADRAATALRAQLGALGLGPESGIAVRIGRVLPIIRDAAHEWGADLVIMAPPPPRNYERMLGTTAERMIRAISLPVLFVHREVRGGYGKALVATDLSDAAVRMTRASAALRLFEGVDTTIVHAFGPPHEGMMSKAGVSDIQVESYARKWKAQLSHELARHAADAGVEPSRVTVVEENASPFRAIERTVRQVQPELLVIGTSRYFMLKRMLRDSVTDEVLRHSAALGECDILVVSPTAAARPQQHASPQDSGSAGWYGRSGGTLEQMKGWDGSRLSAAEIPVRTSR